MAVLDRLGRRNKSGAAVPEVTVVVKAGGKNRPTPTRKQANAARPVTPYLDGPTTKSRGGGRTKTEKRAAAAQRRDAMRRGDLPRDRGPERALARDLTDARRTLLGLLLPATLVAFVFVESRVAILVYLGLLIELGLGTVALVQGFGISRQVEREVLAKYPGSSIRLRGYVIRRAMAPRRWRVPTPRVKPGGGGV